MVSPEYGLFIRQSWALEFASKAIYFLFDFVNHLTSWNRSWSGMRFERSLISYKYICLGITVTPMQMEGLSLQLRVLLGTSSLFFLSFKWSAMFCTKPLLEACYAKRRNRRAGSPVCSLPPVIVWDHYDPGSGPQFFRLRKVIYMISVFQSLGDKLTAKY